MESKIAQIQNNGYLELEQEIDPSAKLEFKKKFAHMAINLWLQAEGADKYRTKIERGKVLDFIKLLFVKDSLFSPDDFDENKRKEILMELVGLKTEIPPITTVTDFVKKNKELAKAFLYDACLIVHLDGRVVNSEAEFLEQFCQYTGLTNEEKSQVYVQFGRSGNS